MLNIIPNLVIELKDNTMFGMFKKKSQSEKLQDAYKKLMAEAHKLSQVNRSAGDAKYAEAQEVLTQIEALEGQS